MLTQTQKLIAQAIVRLFETSTVRGDYSKVTVIPGDTGHVSYGVFQTTLGAGGLERLLKDYCSRPGARFAAQLGQYMPRVEQRDVGLDADAVFKNLLRACADDLVMRDSQDAFFDAGYWIPASRAADKLAVETPLGSAVVFDGFVQGAFGIVQKLATAAVGEPAAVGERAWIAEYVKRRRNWLAGNKRLDLRPTAYRMEAFERLIDQGYWDLPLPLVVRDREISEQSLAEQPPNCYSGPPPGSRALSLQTPLMRGLDVRLVQLALSQREFDVLADGIFGQTSQRVVARFQQASKLPPTGTVDAGLFSTLGLLG